MVIAKYDPLDEYPELCPNTGERHILDQSSFSLDHTADEVYLDVNCRDCGRSGCLGSFKSEDVDW